MPHSDLRIGWYVTDASPAHASVRLRVLGPSDTLRARGHRVEPFDPARGANGYDAIIVSKSIGRKFTRIIESARAQGVPVILDMCDNLVAGAEARGKPEVARAIRLALGAADRICAPTQVLADRLAEQAPGTPTDVVPDMLENMVQLSALAPSLAERWRLRELERFLTRHTGALHCVWFGNSAGKLSGLVHLCETMPGLEAFARERPMTLTIISDTRMAYMMAARRLAVPTHYVPWSLGLFAPALMRHRVALIPVGMNAFTLGKSINRPATALAAGLGVIADGLPSYEELRPYIVLDDWHGGLTRYADDWDRQGERIREGLAALQRRYGAEVIADRWEQVIRAAIGR